MGNVVRYERGRDRDTGVARTHQDHVQNNIGFFKKKKWLNEFVDGNSSKTIEPKREKSVGSVVVVVVVAEIFKF